MTVSVWLSCARFSDTPFRSCAPISVFECFDMFFSLSFEIFIFLAIYAFTFHKLNRASPLKGLCVPGTRELCRRDLTPFYLRLSIHFHSRLLKFEIMGSFIQHNIIFRLEILLSSLINYLFQDKKLYFHQVFISCRLFPVHSMNITFEIMLLMCMLARVILQDFTQISPFSVLVTR